MKITLLFVLALIAAACSASADVMRLDDIVRPPRNPELVRLLLERPDTPYVSIALIEVSDEGWGMSLESLREKLVEEAAKIGGDAVILRQTDSDGTIIPVGQTFISLEVKGLSGQVIVYER